MNYSEVPETVELELEFSNDAADIFEVRGWTRAQRGTYPPIAIRDDRVTFRYDGLDGVRRYTYLAFSERAESLSGNDQPTRDSGEVMGAWRWTLEPGGSAILPTVCCRRQWRGRRRG